jgi:hypothetical protein
VWVRTWWRERDKKKNEITHFFRKIEIFLLRKKSLSNKIFYLREMGGVCEISL